MKEVVVGLNITIAVPAGGYTAHMELIFHSPEVKVKVQMYLRLIKTQAVKTYEEWR
jgi:UDP-galactopyranose mutase